MFAASPETPPGEVQAFEFEKVEKLTDGIRCFPPKGGSVIVTKYKLRGVIPYPVKIDGSDTKLPEQTDSLKAYAAKYPLTRPFLNPKILAPHF